MIVRRMQFGRGASLDGRQSPFFLKVESRSSSWPEHPCRVPSDPVSRVPTTRLPASRTGTAIACDGQSPLEIPSLPRSQHVDTCLPSSSAFEQPPATGYHVRGEKQGVAAERAQEERSPDHQRSATDIGTGTQQWRRSSARPRRRREVWSCGDSQFSVSAASPDWRKGEPPISLARPSRASRLQG